MFSHHSIISLLVPLLHLLNLSLTEQDLLIDAVGGFQLSSSSTTFALIIEFIEEVLQVIKFLLV